MATADQLRQERDLIAIRNQLAMAESRLLEAKKALAPKLPQVIEAGAPAVWRKGNWYGYFPITTSLKEIWWRKQVLQVPLKDQHPFFVVLGMPMVGAEGSYLISNVEVLHPRGTCLPHIDSSSGCLMATGAPPKLLTLEDYWSLHGVLTRHCEGVQLNSLYTSIDVWPEGLVKSLPEEVMDWFGNDDDEEDAGLRRKRMLKIFPNNGSETFDVDEEEEDQPVDRCDCPDYRRARGELVVEDEVEIPEAPQAPASDIWVAEA